MLVGKIIYFAFSFLMTLIVIFWFTQKLSQIKVVNYIMGFLGLIDSIFTVFIVRNNFIRTFFMVGQI